MEERILEWLTEQAGAPCKYVFDNMEVADFMMIHCPEWCYTTCCENIKECWRTYFRTLFYNK